MTLPTPRTAGSIRASLLIAALSCAATASAVQVSYQYYRFTPVKMRDDVASNSVALSELQFLLGGTQVDASNALVTNPNGSNPAAELPPNLTDNNTATKWLDFYKTPVIFSFVEPTAIDGYRFSTGNDAPERDPLRWTLEGSQDGTTWTLLDNITTDFATPTARLTSTTNILLPATVDPAVRDWTGSQSATWDTTSANWSNGNAALWDNTRFDVARFPTGPAAKTISVTEPISVRSLDFTGTGYLVQGNTLTLKGVSRLTGTGSGEVSSVIAGALGVTKTGTGSITLSGNNTFTGAALVRGGTLTLSGTNAYAGATTVTAGGTLVLTGSSAYAGATTVVGGGTLSFAGAATKTAAAGLTVGDVPGNGTMLVGGTSNVVFNGTPLIGTGATGQGVVRQTGGTATYAASGTYLTLGNSAGSWGSYELAGGSLVTVTDGGIRVGPGGAATYNQTGGSLTCGRWFAVAGAAAKGVATFSGGTASVAANYRFIAGDQAGGDGTINIGTEAGGTAVVSPLRISNAANDGAVAVSGNATSTGTLNLNSGILNLSSRLFQIGGTGTVNLNGGTLKAAIAGVELMSASISSVKMYRGGLTIDTNGNDATLNSLIVGMLGKGVYPAGGSIPVTTGGGSGYIGAPFVTVATSGAGTGLSAIATVTSGAVTGITLTCPGDGYVAGDTVTFSFIGGGSEISADNFIHTLTAAELAANTTGGITKTGAGKLTSTTNTSYPGPTTVAAGTLVANAFMDQSPITVAAGATLSGNLTASAPITVNGTLAPGSGLGLISSTSSLKLAPGSIYAMQLSDWNGNPGVGYDTVNADSLSIAATADSKLTVNVDGTGIANFTEAAKQFVLVTSNTAPTGLTASNWQVTTTNFPGAGTWLVSVSGKTLVLSYAPGTAAGYSAWTAGFPTLSDKTQAGDPDNDGIPNVLEYVLNGNPRVSSRAVLPQGSISGSNYVFTFVRRAESKSDTTQSFEYGSNLTTWTAIPIPAATNAAVTVTANQPSTGLETVVVTVPVSSAVNGRLFGRLNVTTTP